MYLSPLVVACLAMALAGHVGPVREAGAVGGVAGLVEALSSNNALAEWHAARQLVAAGDAAVAPLARLAGASGPLPPRLVAVELLGEIGTRAARDALIDLLRREQSALAIRGQLCVQLGRLRERRAIPAIADWLARIGPRSLHDVSGPKEVQPSTCYIRHVEALAMIGDAQAIPILETFLRKIPKNVGYGGFITNFVTGATRNALLDVRANAAFWAAVRRRPGLEARLAPLFRHFHADAVARFRHYESEVVEHSPQGQAILRRLSRHTDPALAAAARQLLRHWDSLASP